MFGPKRITKADVEQARSASPRRISFAYAHSEQPKRLSNQGDVGRFAIPFGETIASIFTADTGIHLYDSKFGGLWRAIKTEAEFQAIQTWKERQGTRIFLRDCLDLSMALDQNFTDTESGLYTTLGALEARAKETPDEEAIAGLVEHLAAAIRDLPHYRDTNLIAAVPPRPGKVYDLPTRLASQLGATVGLEDLTGHFAFTGNREAIKSLEVERK